MDKDDEIKAVEFKWNDTADIGVIAQEVGGTAVDISSYGGGSYTITMNDTIDLGNLSITSNPSYTYNTGGYTFSSGVNSISGVNEINTASGKKIDLDELSDVVESLKKRLLILAPNFEMHEKYPMLKELYDEYKALEKLLSGPDSSEDQ